MKYFENDFSQWTCVISEHSKIGVTMMPLGIFSESEAWLT